ncbi:MAG: HU family DNA-binding protein [Bacteroidaceae bacterium]|nr:HU family DNA-binding protein [Bacteroidaceae bacterium]
MGLVKMRKSQRQLTYMEGKPTVYQLKQLIYAPIKEKDLIKYISQSANVPESTIEAAILGIANGILYYAINGHQVTFPGFGGFWCSLKAKTARTLAELKTKDVTRSLVLHFSPNEALRQVIAGSGTTVVDDGVYGIE